MAEKVLPDGRITDIKHKYTCPKTRGTYKTAGGDGRLGDRQKRKKTKTEPSMTETVKVIAKDGKVRWETRPRQRQK